MRGSQPGAGLGEEAGELPRRVAIVAPGEQAGAAAAVVEVEPGQDRGVTRGDVALRVGGAAGGVAGQFQHDQAQGFGIAGAAGGAVAEAEHRRLPTVEGRPQIRVRIAAPAGSGKSTLARMIGDCLAAQGIPITLPPRMRRRSAADHRRCVDALKRRGTIVAVSETDRERSGE